MRGSYQHTFTVLLIVALFLVFCPSTIAQNPNAIDETELARELAQSLNKWTGGASCSRRLHVILEINTTQTFTGSSSYRAFQSAWSQLLRTYFRPDDKFSLIGFGSITVPASPVSRSYGDPELDNWFQNPPPIEQNGKDLKGTLVQMARLDGLKRAKASTATDPNRATLVLVVGDRPIDPYTEKQKREDPIESQAADQLAHSWSLDTHSVQPEHFFVYWSTSTERKPHDLLIWHEFEKAYERKAQPSVWPDRSITRTSVDRGSTTEPTDNRAKFQAAGIVLLFLCWIPVMFMRSRVDITQGGTNHAQRIDVLFWQKIPVRVCSTRDENDPAVILRLANASDVPQDVGEIEMKTPGTAVWRKLPDGYLADGNEVPVAELPLPYSAQTEALAASDPSNKANIGRVLVTPASWLDGKLGPLMGLFVMLVAGLMFLAAANKPLPPAETTPTEDTVPVCMDGKPV